MPVFSSASSSSAVRLLFYPKRNRQPNFNFFSLFVCRCVVERRLFYQIMILCLRFLSFCFAILERENQNFSTLYTSAHALNTRRAYVHYIAIRSAHAQKTHSHTHRHRHAFRHFFNYLGWIFTLGCCFLCVRLLEMLNMLPIFVWTGSDRIRSFCMNSKAFGVEWNTLHFASPCFFLCDDWLSTFFLLPPLSFHSIDFHLIVDLTHTHIRMPANEKKSTKQKKRNKRHKR